MRLLTRVTLGSVNVNKAAHIFLFCFVLIVVVFVLFSSAVSSESSLEEGWDTEDIEIPDEDLPSEQTRSAKTLMDEAKAGHVEELQPPFKVT